MESFKIEDLSFAYPAGCGKVLENISFTVTKGEFVLLCGRSGCGKTTLLRLLKSSLSPSGEISGNIYFNGKALSDCDAREQAAEIGFVMQSPDNQIVTDKVWHELAFGLESLGYSQAEIRMRVSEMASFFGIQKWFYSKVTELSGGQKQLLNLASVMASAPSVLILDEPASQLDPIAAAEFLKTIERLNREMGTTVILAEHRLEDALPIADRVIVMEDGKIIADEAPEAIGSILRERKHYMYKALPTPVRVHGRVSNTMPCPLTVRDGRIWLEEFSAKNTLNTNVIPKDKEQDDSEAVVEIKDAWFRYKKDLPDVIKGFNLTVRKGEIFCMVGGNGTGKTTVLSLISGINTPYRGEVLIKGQNISKTGGLYNGLLGVLPQNPQSVFVKKTVFLDLMEVLRDKGLTGAEKEQRVNNVSALCRIERLWESHPYDLSGGEQQRAAIAKILLTEPEILVLDEPTKGMDAHFKEEFADILLDLKTNGITILIVSHDIEFCAEYADSCALVFDGSIISAGAPREFFRGNNFYTTSANRMARAVLPDAVLAEDIILACGGNAEKRERQPRRIELHRNVNEAGTERQKVPGQAGGSLWTAFLILLIIPLTIYMGVSVMGDRKYYFISILIILEAVIPFCMVFEKRKPKAREIVVISVLCAIAVAGRAAFFMLPQFKPVIAIVIIAGICFGGEAGFLVGAISGFVSNFFFGQGPWTPWQMFAFGIIGFSAGLLLKYGLLRRKKEALCIFGFFATFIIYGGIMNPASVIMWQNKITMEMVLSAFIMGVPFDLIHALGTAFFLWLISEPMIDKLERIKVKYGLI